MEKHPERDMGGGSILTTAVMIGTIAAQQVSQTEVRLGCMTVH